MSDYEMFAVWTAVVFLLGAAAGVLFMLLSDALLILVGYVAVALGWL